MAYETKVNTGVLFKNEDKEAETHADYNGTIMLEDGEHWLNCWINKMGENSKTPGKNYMSLSIGKLKQPSYQDDKPQTSAQAAPQDDLDDQIPF